jgi:chemotaxis protein methyltransferase CheR
VSAPLDPGEVARFRDLVAERVGLSFPPSRLSDIEWAVRKAVAETGLPDAGALYRVLVDHPGRHGSLDALVSALNVSETHFLRDRGQIRALEERILPEIIGRRRPERRLRVWSAACSTGEEAYTLAILIRQQLPDLAEWDVRILATDVNGRALERARQGRYGPWSFRGVSPEVRHTWFLPDGERWRVVPRIRAMVTFEQLNLVDPPAAWSPADPGKADLILCRNVLLYFDGATARAVVGRLGGCLDDHGWLLLSQVEAALGSFEGLELDGPGGGAFRKAPPAPPRARRAAGEPAPRPRGAAGRPPRAAAPEARSVPAPRPPLAPRRPPVPAEDPAVPAAYQAAVALWKDHRPADALRRLQLEGSRDQLTAPLHYLHGLILLDQGRADQALAALRRCTFADPGFALGHLAQASLFTRAGNRGRAMAALEQAARLVAGLDPQARVFGGDELRVGALLELVDAQRSLLGRRPEAEVVDG